MNKTDETEKLCELHSCLAKLLSTTMTMQLANYLLKQKRATLEEKMIGGYIDDLRDYVHEYVHACHLHLGRDAFDIDTDVLQDLTALASDMERVFKELIKAIQYNPNYLEQYFEHDFYAQLENEHRFKERLEKMQSCVLPL